MRFLVLWIVFQSCRSISGEGYQWFQRDEKLPSQRLTGHVIEEKGDMFSVLQCAMACSREQRCQSYNYYPREQYCEINDATNEDNEEDVEPHERAVYYSKNAYTIDPAALGPCGSNPCAYKGRCINTRSPRGETTFMCICFEGWAGQTCNETEATLAWSEWKSWGGCSVSCGGGFQTRERDCINIETAEVKSVLDCYGRHHESQTCNSQPCPVWDSWSEWGVCSTHHTCGHGVKLRVRQCTRGGTPGVDRGCLGLHNDTATCVSPGCDTPISLEARNTHGEGRLLVYNDREAQWGPVCADNWDKGDADLVCRQMGYLKGAQNAVSDGAFGKSNLPYQLSNVECSGSELSLQRCKHGGWTGTDVTQDAEDWICKTNTEAGVRCVVDGAWGMWTTWGDCSQTCANGQRERVRDCDHPPALRGGDECTGEQNQYKHCNLRPCPVDAVWLPWESWQDCTTTCGGGTKVRQRTCQLGLHGGAECDGPSSESGECNVKSCPMDGAYGDWSAWTTCTTSCGGGLTTRHRECILPQNGGRGCEDLGPADEQMECNNNECPVDGVWEPWTEWNSCDVTCGGGMRMRTRECRGPFHNGAECDGDSTEQEPCSTESCPIDGVWEEWAAWDACTVTCGGGQRMRSRACIGPFHGGELCDGPTDDSGYCRDNPCPVDGAWSEWTRWLECSLTCGDGGQQMRYRTCSDALHGGAECDGQNEEYQECDMVPCPVDGYWLPWQDWSACSTSCSYGTRTRERECVEQQHEGIPCQGPGQESEECFEVECPVDGFWQSWEEWSPCSLTCGNGTKTRVRTCEEPLFDGAECVGQPWDEAECLEKHCPIDGFWHEWSEWTTCSVTCSDGIQTRSRECEKPQYDGGSCDGVGTQQRDCWDRYCPIDGYWAEWSSWADCTTSCGGGKQGRERTCIEPEHEGAACSGPTFTEQDCNTQPCPIPGDWMEWGEWAACSLTCGGGTRVHHRECDMESFGSLTAPCLGPDNKSGPCNSFDCDPVPTCSGWVEKGLMNSGWVQVRPDYYHPPFYIWCDTKLRDGVGVTVFHHNHEQYQNVHGYEGSGEYAAPIIYYENITSATLDPENQVAKLVDVSDQCEQFISWQCLSAGINPPPNEEDKKWRLTYWSNRFQESMIYWGGTRHDIVIETQWTDYTICACAETTSCANPEMPCNCDMNDDVWRVDEGMLTHKPDLPVTGFYAGDTAQMHEEGKSLVGPLYCWGQIPGAGAQWKK